MRSVPDESGETPAPAQPTTVMNVIARLADAAPAASHQATKRPIFFVTSAAVGKNPLCPARLGGAIDP